MQILQNIDMDKFVIVVPTALIAMYLIISLQKSLSERSNKYLGLILPVICFVFATILAFRPLFIVDSAESDGLVLFCLRMWVTFNLPTVVFLFPYLRHRGQMKRMKAEMGAQGTSLSGVTEDKSAGPEQENSDGCGCGFFGCKKK